METQIPSTLDYKPVLVFEGGGPFPLDKYCTRGKFSTK